MCIQPNKHKKSSFGQRRSFKICAYNEADASIGKKLKMMLPESIVERTKACLISTEELEAQIDKMLGGLEDSYLESYEKEEDFTAKDKTSQSKKHNSFANQVKKVIRKRPAEKWNRKLLEKFHEKLMSDSSSDDEASDSSSSSR